MPLPELISQAIREKYAPRTPKGEIRGDVLWVGSLLDGLTIHLPEVLEAAFNQAILPQDARRHWVALLAQSTVGGDAAWTLTAAGFTLTMAREEWKDRPASARTPAIALTARVVSEEPGTLMNSYLIQNDPESGEIRVYEKPKGVKPPTKDFDPLILENRPYGLHYLLRGDRFTATFTRRGGRQVTLRFSLRPPSEGSSLLSPEQAVGLGSW